MTAHPARWAAPCLGFVLAVVGLIFGRPGLVLLGVPLVLMVLWPAGAEGEIVVRRRFTSDGHRGTQVVAGGRRQIESVLASVHTGPQPAVITDWDAHGPFLLSHTPAKTERSQPKVVLPKPMALGRVPQSRRLRGLTGPVTSTRAGDGFELRDVHQMGPADSSHRIDWKVTARQTRDDSIWVRGTFATGETIAIMMIDSRDDVGPSLNTWYSSTPLPADVPTSLDAARHAAASVARALIVAGARVGLVDLAATRRALPAAAGRRQLSHLLYALALTAPVGVPRKLVRAPQVPADAIVYLFSTLLDDEPIRLVRALKDGGHQVLVIDTLPLVRPVAELNLDMAWRIMRAERAVRVGRLQSEHVPLIPWTAAGREHAARQFAAIERSWQREVGR